MCGSSRINNYIVQDLLENLAVTKVLRK